MWISYQDRNLRGISLIKPEIRGVSVFFVTRQAFGVDCEVQHFFTSSTFATEKLF